VVRQALLRAPDASIAHTPVWAGAPTAVLRRTVAARMVTPGDGGPGMVEGEAIEGVNGVT
jgi:hypothetical protein